MQLVKGLPCALGTIAESVGKLGVVLNPFSGIQGCGQLAEGKGGRYCANLNNSLHVDDADFAFCDPSSRDPSTLYSRHERRPQASCVFLLMKTTSPNYRSPLFGSIFWTSFSTLRHSVQLDASHSHSDPSLLSELTLLQPGT